MQSRVLALLISVVLALVATVALVVYVNGADRRAISNQQPVQVYVAAKPIPAGTRGEDAINRQLVEVRPVARSNVTGETIRSPNQLVQRLAAVDIVPGEQLLRRRWVGSEDVAGRRLLQIPPGHQALSIELDLTRQVAGFVTPGDHVSLILTMTRPRNGRPPIPGTEVLLHDIRVLAVGATALANTQTQSGGRVAQGRGSQNLTAVTLAVEPEDAVRVVYAVEHGSIYMTLLPPDAGQRAGNVATADNVVSRAE